MNKRTSMTIQMILVVLQSVNIGGAIPPQAQVYVAAAISALQGVLAVMAHNYNPDGTPAAAAYLPPEKR